MKPLPAGIILLTAAVVVSGALAIEPPQPEPAGTEPAGQEAPPAPAPREEPAPGEEAAQAGEPAAEEAELPPLPPEAAPAGPPPQRFNPTEKVRADFPVSFPIDI